MHKLLSVVLLVAAGCASTSNGRAYMDAAARHAPEPQALWARPQEVAFTLGNNDIEGEATTIRILGLFTFGADDGLTGTVFDTLFNVLGLGAAKGDPLVQAAAAAAMNSSQNTDGIYVTSHEVTNLNLLIFQKRTAVVRGKPMQLRSLGEVSVDRADRERMLRAISGSQIHVPPEMVNQAR